jgi:hypothetical protein
VWSADLTEEHLQNPLLLFVSHDRPVVDDGLQPLTLKNYRGSRGLRLELVAFDEQVASTCEVLALVDIP